MTLHAFNLTMLATDTQPATAPVAATGATTAGELRVLLPLLAVGTALLIVWLIRRMRSPGLLSLQAAPPRPNRLTPLHVMGSFVAMVLLSIPASLPTVKNYAYGDLLATLLTQVGWVTASLLAAGWTFAHGLRGGFGLTLRQWPGDTARAVLTLLTVLPAVMGLLLVSGVLVEWAVRHGWLAPESDREHPLLTLVRSVGPMGKVLIVLSAVVLAPLTEELFFRGLLQSLLRNFMSPWAAIVISSVLFALMHLSAIRSVLPLLLLSLVLGFAYERHGRLSTPILIHALFNAVMLTATLTA
jgi:membrane protease YdiL (CAAX protease family)